MKLKIYISRISPFLLLLLFLSCSAEDGQDGLQGEQGPPGIDGQDGADGMDGNANVISSDWFGIETWDPTDLPRLKLYRIPDLELTDAQMDNDVFLVYRRYQPSPESTFIDMLPFTSYNTSDGTMRFEYNNYIVPNNMFIEIRSVGVDIPDVRFQPPQTQFRYILIPANNITSKRNMDFTKMSYQEVVDYLGINP